MSFDFTVSAVIPASPKAIYDAWLSAHGHAKMTGTKAANISAVAGAAFTVWDGFISGENLELDPSASFNPGARQDSRIAIPIPKSR